MNNLEKKIQFRKQPFPPKHCRKIKIQRKKNSYDRRIKPINLSLTLAVQKGCVEAKCNTFGTDDKLLMCLTFHRQHIIIRKNVHRNNCSICIFGVMR